MGLPIEDWVLLLADNEPDKTLDGRERFYKKMYFLSVLNKLDFDFGPHYFGPYSSVVSSALDLMIGLDFLVETRQVIPHGKFNLMGSRFYFKYKLSDGNGMDQVIKEIYDVAEPMGYVDSVKFVNEKTEGIPEKILSSAAHCHYSIYYQSNHDISPELMKQVIKGWGSSKIEYKDMNKVIELLESLGLDRR